MSPPYSFPSRRPDPPPRRKSRPITLVLLGAAALSGCCCLWPAPQEAAPAEEISGDFGDPDTPTTDRSTPTTDGSTPSTARTAAQSGTQQAQSGGYRRSYVPFWMPLFFGSGFGRGGYNRGPVVTPGPSGTRPGGSNNPGVTRGGFGGTGRSVGGGTGSSGS